MRILQVAPDYYPRIGGVERHVRAISERMVADGHTVEVATIEPPDQHIGDEVLDGVVVHRFGAVGNGTAYRVPVGMLHYMRQAHTRFDIIHAHNYHAILLPLVAAARPSTLVITPHLNDRAHSRVAQLLHYPYSLVGSWSLRAADAVVCVTAAERERVIKRLGVARNNTVVIPNGVGDDIFTTTATRETGLLVVVGRLEAYKRVDQVIAAVGSLPQPYRLVVVGDGPARPALEALVADQGLTERVHFTGRVSDAELVEWYSRADVLLNMSLAEAFGITVLEAVAAGCQVVCSDIPAFRELAGEFPQRITTFAGNEPTALATTIIQTAEKSVVANLDLSSYRWDAIAQRLVELYTGLRNSEQHARQTNELQAGRVR